MQSYDNIQVLEALCKATKKWGIYLNPFVPEDYSGPWFDEQGRFLAALCLNEEEHTCKSYPIEGEPYSSQIVPFDCGWLLFDTKKECYAAYDTIVGDDGPTKSNPYNGPIRVYAITCNPKGETETENT